jgi:hypothetical protein
LTTGWLTTLESKLPTRKLQSTGSHKIIGTPNIQNRGTFSRFSQIQSSDAHQSDAHFLANSQADLKSTRESKLRMVVFTRALALLMAVTFTEALVAPKPSFSTRVSPLAVATSEDVTTADFEDFPDCVPTLKNACSTPLFKNVMAANRAEIAVRIMRAATEMNSGTVAIYGHEDRYSQHRWGADRSYQLDKDEAATPISAYLDIEQIIKIAKKANVDAIHPGYVSMDDGWCQIHGVTPD